MAGTGGLLLRTDNGGGPCVDPASVRTPESAAWRVRLDGAFPMSRASRSSLVVWVRDTQAVTAEVFDVRGQTRARLLDEVLAGGSPRSVPLERAKLTPGVYLLRVEGAAFRTARKLVVAGD